MKFYLLSDNIDTKMGMRLAGIEGVVIHEAEEVERELLRVMDDPEVGVVLMTNRLIVKCGGNDPLLQTSGLQGQRFLGCSGFYSFFNWLFCAACSINHSLPFI